MSRLLSCGIMVVGAVAVLAAAEPSRSEAESRRIVDRYLTSIAQRCWTARAERVAALRTPGEVAARQRYILETILKQLGGFPQKTPLRPRITGTLQRNSYRVEKLIFESQPGYYVTASVYVPAGEGPFAAAAGSVRACCRACPQPANRS